jgi:peroxiredoxin
MPNSSANWESKLLPRRVDKTLKGGQRVFQISRLWMVVVAAGFAAMSVGCSSETSHRPDARSSAKEHLGEGVRRQQRAAVKPKLEEPPLPPVTIPKVKLSDELRKNCLVQVGDVMPKAELPDRAGKTQRIASLYGQKLTVVCLWTAADRRSQLEAAETLRSLTNDIAKPFAGKGVRVIAIEVARNTVVPEARQNIRETVSKLPFPCLMDGKGQFLGSVCKDDKLPRVYLLDADGKILWFDVEYSRSTREDLTQGIRVALGELK